MCFGKKDYYDKEEPARPAPGQFPAQPTYSKAPAKVSPQQQTPQPFVAELAAPTSAPVELPGGDFAPPPGPPPSFGKAADDYTAPPPGPPPSHTNPVHDWESVVPDTSLFPPPPDIFSGWDRSPATNATEAEAEAGERWCAQHQLTRPIVLDAPALDALRRFNIRLMRPDVGFRGALDWVSPGVWTGKTEKNSRDGCIIGYPPLYSVTEHSPLAADRPKTVYYEVVIKNDSRRDETSLAMGFTALPYPSFRLPGWHRGSLAVHGDDGHKYINDRWGGKTFTQPFRRGETYGIGMTFTPVSQGKLEVEVFFTRNGSESERWNLHEETDKEQDLPVTGLEGFHDLSCAIGTFDMVSFDVIFAPERWAYKGIKL